MMTKVNEALLQTNAYGLQHKIELSTVVNTKTHLLAALAAYVTEPLE